MRVTTTDKKTESNSDLLSGYKRVEFRQTAEAFELYSKRLYKHRFSSVFRENFSNHADSHCRRGGGFGDVPFIVTLPTPDNPVITSRDYGTGMEFDDMSNFFDFNASDKRGEDVSTGSLGIGAKAPYAIASQFTVTCYSGSYKQVYLVTKDEQGFPLRPAHPPAKIPCDEPRGVEIAIPIDLDECSVEKAEEHVRNVASVFGHYGSPYHVRPIVLRDEFVTTNKHSGAVTTVPAITASEEDQAEFYDTSTTVAAYLRPEIVGRYIMCGGDKTYLIRYAGDIELVSSFPGAVTIQYVDGVKYYQVDLSMLEGSSIASVEDAARCLMMLRNAQQITIGDVRCYYAEMIGCVAFANTDNVQVDKYRSASNVVNGTSYVTSSIDKLRRPVTAISVFLGNVEYSVTPDAERLRRNINQLVSAVSGLSETSISSGDVCTAIGPDVLILLHNTRPDGSPHTITWQPSREGLVEGETTEYLEQLFLEALGDVLRTACRLFSDLVNNDIQNVHQALSVCRNLYPGLQDLFADLAEKAIRDLWPYPFAMDATVETDLSYCFPKSNKDDEYSAPATGRVLTARDLFVGNYFTFGRKAVLLLIGSVYIHDSIYEVAREYSDDDIVILRGPRSHEASAVKLLTEDFHVDVNRIFYGQAIAKQAAPKRATVHTGSKTLPVDHVRVHDDTNAGGYTSQITKSWTDLTLRVVDDILDSTPAYGLSKEGLCLSYKDNTSPKPLFLGVGFYGYRIAVGRNPKSDNPDSSTPSLSPTDINRVSISLNALGRLLLSREVKVLGINKGKSSSWQWVTDELLSYCNTLLAANTELVRRSCLHHALTKDVYWRDIPSPVNIMSYVATDSDQFSPNSVLGRELLKFKKTVDATNDFSLGMHRGAYDSIYCLVKNLRVFYDDARYTKCSYLSKCREQFESLLNSFNEPIPGWEASDTKATAEMLTEAYPALHRVSTHDTEYFGDSWSPMSNDILTYIRCVDYARKKVLGGSNTAGSAVHELTA